MGASYFNEENLHVHAFIWDELNGMIDLGTLGGSEHSYAWDINDLGQVVGDMPHPFISDGTIDGMIDLNTLIDANSGWMLEYARAINNLGQITGSGRINGETHAFLLTPIDADGDGFPYDADCNDLDPSINPNACDIKKDGIDQNCDHQDRTTAKPCVMMIRMIRK